MCQVLGVSFARPAPFNKIWEIFRQRAAQNPDGWGIAYGDSGGLAVVKQPDRADRSPLAAAFGKTELPAPVMIGHVRLASRGNPALTNTHPFFAHVNGRDWAMVHNGHLNRYGFTPGQHGQTDSEAFFLRLVDLLESAGGTGPYAVAGLMAEEAREAGRCGRLNVLLTDGEHFFVHTNIAGSLYQLQSSAGTMVCTAPLDRRRGWRPVATNIVHVFREGKPIYTVPVRWEEVRPACIGRQWQVKSVFA